MIENMMVISIFITVLSTFIVLGLLMFSACYIFVDKIHEIRKAKMQKRLDEELKRINRDLGWLQRGDSDE